MDMLEEGIVRTVEGDRVKVEIIPVFPEKCAASCAGCREGPSGRFLDLAATPELTPGTKLLLKVPEPRTLGPAVVVFLLPILAILAGAVLGGLVPGWIGRPEMSSVGFSTLGALLLLGGAALVIRTYDRRVQARRPGPRIVRIER